MIVSRAHVAALGALALVALSGGFASTIEARAQVSEVGPPIFVGKPMETAATITLVSEKSVTDPSEVRQFIDEANRKFSAAIARKDYAGIAAIYTVHAKMVPPDVPIVSGAKTIEDFWRTTVEALGLSDMTLNTVDLEVDGDVAIEIGEAALKVKSGQAKAKYLVIWRKDSDGIWRLHRDIWNMPST
jgi:ketosteroid isomerase-like protein